MDGCIVLSFLSVTDVNHFINSMGFVIGVQGLGQIFVETVSYPKDAKEDLKRICN